MATIFVQLLEILKELPFAKNSLFTFSFSFSWAGVPREINSTTERRLRNTVLTNEEKDRQVEKDTDGLISQCLACILNRTTANLSNMGLQEMIYTDSHYNVIQTHIL